MSRFVLSTQLPLTLDKLTQEHIRAAVEFQPMRQTLGFSQSQDETMSIEDKCLYKTVHTSKQ